MENLNHSLIFSFTFQYVLIDVPLFLPFLLKLHALIEYENTETAEKAVHILTLFRLFIFYYYYYYFLARFLFPLPDIAAFIDSSGGEIKR